MSMFIFEYEEFNGAIFLFWGKGPLLPNPDEMLLFGANIFPVLMENYEKGLFPAFS